MVPTIGLSETDFLLLHENSHLVAYKFIVFYVLNSGWYLIIQAADELVFP